MTASQTAPRNALQRASRTVSLAALHATPETASGRLKRGILSADGVAVTALLACIAIAVGFRFQYDNWLSEYDIFSYFLPNFGYVGDRIRDLEVPAWNPYFLSGTITAGDAGAGWMYLPMMIGFSLFTSAATGMKVMVLIQTLVAGVATYAFGRRIGFHPLAALLSATAFAIGPMLYGATTFVTIIGQVSPFMAVGMLGVESALRTTRLSSRLGWSALSGIAISQMFLAWPQGFVYGCMVIGGWMGYRWLLAPVAEVGSRMIHLQRLLVTGIAMGIIAAAFGAAGILPRLDFSGQSTIPGGDYTNVIGGAYASYTAPIVNTLAIYLQDSLFWRPLGHSTVLLVLGLLAVVLGRNRYGIPFFAVAALIFIDLSVTESLTRDVFYLIPGFEHVHGHRPTASNSMVFFPFAMLGGAGLQLLIAGKYRRSAPALAILKLVPLILIVLMAVWADRSDLTIGWWPIWLAVATTVLILLPDLPLAGSWHGLRNRLTPIAVTGLLVLFMFFPNGVDFYRTLREPAAGANWRDLLAKDPERQEIIGTVLGRSDPDGAAAYLQDQQALLQPFRYAPFFNNVAGPGYVSSSQRRMEPELVAILANGRSARLGLEQTSGYNPLQIKYYAEYVAAMNGAPQDYHWLDIFAPALNGTQLFDMLNVRYVLVAANLAEAPGIAGRGQEVYRDEYVVVYENLQVFPRAWMVHIVGDNKDGEGLLLLNSGMIDGHQIAYVDGPLPEVAVPTGSGPGDEVTIISHEPERIEIAARSRSAGLLVVSEVYAEGWNAYVDGERIDILRTNHALRGVPLPAGEHTVVMKYEPRSLTIGLWSTGLASVGMIGVWSWALVEWRRQGETPIAPTQAIAASREEKRESTRARLAATKRLVRRTRRAP